MFAFLLILAGCKSTTEGDGVLTIWAWDPLYNIDIMNKATDIYKETNPDVEVEIVDIANSDVYQSLHTAFASGTIEGLPDIVLIEDMQAPQFLASYPDAFYALDNVVNYDDFLDYKVDACTYEGETYCLPFDSGVTGLWYREDYITAAGFTDEDMQDLTWSEYFDIAETVYEKTGKKMLSIQLDDLVYVRMMLQSAGTWYDDANYDDFSQNPALIEALKNTKIIGSSDWAKQVLDWNEYISSVQSGDVGGVINGMWFIPTIKQADDQSGLWRMAATPRLETVDSTNVSNSGGSAWYIVNGTGDEELAADFLNTAYTDVDFYNDIMENNFALGSYVPAYGSDVFNETDDFFGGQEINGTLAKWAKEIPTVTYGPDFNTIQSAIIGEIQAYVDGKEDLDTLMENAKATASE